MKLWRFRMKTIFSNGTAVSKYIIIPKRFAYIKVPQKSSYGRQCLPIQRFFICVLTLCSLSCKLEKTHWWRPTKCAILSFLIKYLLCKREPLLKYAVCKYIDSPRKKNRSMCVNSLFSFSETHLCNTDDILYRCQRIKQGFMVFCEVLLST